MDTEPALLLVIAEDDPPLRLLLETRLTRDGFRIRAAADGAEALDMLQGELPAVLITDLQMPRVDGLELCRAVRADSRTTAVPVLVLTGQSEEDARVRDLAAMENVTILFKPVPLATLTSTVRSLAAPGPVIP